MSAGDRPSHLTAADLFQPDADTPKTRIADNPTEPVDWPTALAEGWRQIDEQARERMREVARWRAEIVRAFDVTEQPAFYIGRHRLADEAVARLLTEWCHSGDWSPNDVRAYVGLPPVDVPYAWGQHEVQPVVVADPRVPRHMVITDRAWQALTGEETTP